MKFHFSDSTQLNKNIFRTLKLMVFELRDSRPPPQFYRNMRDKPKPLQAGVYVHLVHKVPGGNSGPESA